MSHITIVLLQLLWQHGDGQGGCGAADGGGHDTPELSETAGPPASSLLLPPQTCPEAHQVPTTSQGKPGVEKYIDFKKF